MFTEELYEEGIVKESRDGFATVIISGSDHCEECTAKLYCKPGNSNERSLIASDPYGAKSGDKVRVSIKGSKLISASFLLYGIPLILLLSGLLIGMQIFTGNKEFYSTLLSLVLILLYILEAYMISKKSKQKISSHPEIVFIKTSLN